MASTTRSPGGKWLKGQSGNPGGRPAIAKEVREAAQRHAPEAIAELHRLMTESADDRVICFGIAQELMGENGFGWWTDESVAQNRETLALLGQDVPADLWDRSVLEEVHGS